MVQYDKMILNRLLDTYESSLLSTGENRRNIHIEFRFTKKALPAYFDESSSEYERIHFFMESLEEKQLIRICWQGGRKGHIIARVQLRTENLETAYAFVRRVPKQDLAAIHRQLLKECLAKEPTPVCRAFAAHVLERLAEHKSVKEFVQLEDIAFTRRLLAVIEAIEKNEEPLYLREFSIRHFQDSKAFEKMEGRIAHIFRRFQPGCEEAAVEEILAEYGIYHTPDYVYLKGNATLLVGAEKIDLSVLKQGLGISGEDIGRIRFAGTAAVKQVITIENLTTFSAGRRKTACLYIWAVITTASAAPCLWNSMRPARRRRIITSGILTPAGSRSTVTCGRRRAFPSGCTGWIWRRCRPMNNTAGR